MKVGSLFLIFTFFILVVASIVLSYESVEEEDFFNSEFLSRMGEVMDSRQERIEDYFSERQRDLSILAKSKKVKELLKQDLISFSFLVKDRISEQSIIIFKEVEIYLNALSETSLSDLKKSEGFESVAVQNVGGDSYSMVYDSDSFIIYFHKDSSLIGKKLNELIEGFPNEMSVSKKDNVTTVLSGFFNLNDSKGFMKRNYGEFFNLSFETKEGIQLSVGVVGLVEDYKVINISKEGDEYLENFVKYSGYHNLFLISKEGYVIYAVEGEDFLGANVFWEEYNNTASLVNFLQVLDEESVSFFGPFIPKKYNGYLENAIMDSVFEDGAFVGAIQLVLGMKTEVGIVEDTTGLEDKSSAFLINEEGFLITPLKSGKADLLVQKIENLNSETCSKDLKLQEEGHQLVHDRSNSIDPYLNYRGDSVIGEHVPIFFPKWCLLTEFDVGLVSEKRQEISFNFVKFFFLFSLQILVFLGGKYFLDRNYVLRTGVIKYHLFKNNFLQRISFKQEFFLSILITSVYSLFVILLIGFKFGKSFDLVLAYLFSVMSFLLFFHVFKLEDNKLKLYLFFSSLFFMLYSLISIPIWLYIEKVNVFNNSLFAILTFFKIIAFMLLLFFFEGGVKK